MKHNLFVFASGLTEGPFKDFLISSLLKQVQQKVFESFLKRRAVKCLSMYVTNKRFSVVSNKKSSINIVQTNKGTT